MDDQQVPPRALTTTRQVIIACLIVAVAVGGIVLVRAATTVRVEVTDVTTSHIVNYHLGVGTCIPDPAAGNTCPEIFVRLLPQIESPANVAEDAVAGQLGIELPGRVTISAVCAAATGGGTEVLYPTGTRYRYRVRISPPFFRPAETSRVMSSFVPDGHVSCRPAGE